jgi:hypothetical protein
MIPTELRCRRRRHHADPLLKTSITFEQVREMSALIGDAFKEENDTRGLRAAGPPELGRTFVCIAAHIFQPPGKVAYRS